MTASFKLELTAEARMQGEPVPTEGELAAYAAAKLKGEVIVMVRMPSGGLGIAGLELLNVRATAAKHGGTGC